MFLCYEICRNKTSVCFFVIQTSGKGSSQRGMWRFVVLIFVCCVFCATGARADIASAGYVNDIVSALDVQSDWAQTDSNARDFIRNKPEIPSPDAVEYIDNKVLEISDSVTDNQYPSARAVNNALSTKADVNDVRFNTVPTSQPVGTPPAGQVFIWFN